MSIWWAKYRAFEQSGPTSLHGTKGLTYLAVLLMTREQSFHNLDTWTIQDQETWPLPLKGGSLSFLWRFWRKFQVSFFNLMPSVGLCARRWNLGFL
jgi:hypothetical protein